MPGENLKEIDKSKDTVIVGQEIKDFLDAKNKNFLPNETNLQAIAKEIDDNINYKSLNIKYAIDDISLFQAYMDVENKIKQKKEITPSDIKLLKLWMYVKEWVKGISFADEQDYTKNIIVVNKINSINIWYINPLFQRKSPLSIVSVQNKLNQDKAQKTNILPKMKETWPAKNSISQIENWYKETFPNEYKKLQDETQEKSDFYERTHTFHRTNIISPMHLAIQAGDQLNKVAGYRTPQEKIIYQSQENRYMMLLQIINAYAESQQKEIGTILTWAWWDEDIYKKEADYYMSYINYCTENQQILTDFEIQKKWIEGYSKQIENLMKKYYTWNIKEKKADEIVVKNFNDELNKKYWTGENKIKLEKASKKMDMDVSKLSWDKNEDIDFFLQYLQDVEGMKSKYGKEKIDRYSKFNDEILPIYNKNKVKIKQLENTQKHIDELFGNNKFDSKRIDNFQNIAKKIQISQKNIEIALWNYQNNEKSQAGLLENIVNSSPDFSMLYKAGWKNVDPSAQQRELDKRYASQPTIIQYAHTIWSAIANVWTNFIGGIGGMRIAGLSALPLWDSWQNSVKGAGYIWNKDIIDPYTIEQTSLEQWSIVENGRFNADKLSRNFREAFDGSKVSGSGVTWTSQWVSTIANMILLIYWWKSLWGRNIWLNLWKMSFQWTTWLIKMSMLMSVWPSFKKYSDAWFDPQMASMAAFLESWIVSWLELINVGPYFTKDILKKIFTKQFFVTTILKDLWGENIQELTQTWAEKFMEIVTNNLWDFVWSTWKIDVNFTVEEAMNTIILTSIATLLVSGPWNIKNVKNNNTSYAYYEKMKTKPEMAANFINFVTRQKGKMIELPWLEWPQMIDDALIIKISDFLKNTPGVDVENIAPMNPEIVEANNNLEKIFTTEKWENLLNNIKSPEVKKEMVQLMKENIDKWLLDLQNGKAYMEVNGQRVESELFKELEKNFWKEQAIFTWLQVRTENFKNWFGDWQWNPTNASKVVDNNWEPLVVYHWTNRGFDKFQEKDWARRFKNTWFHFASNHEFVKEYEEKWINIISQTLWNISTEIFWSEIIGKETIKLFNEVVNDLIKNWKTSAFYVDGKYPSIKFVYGWKESIIRVPEFIEMFNWELPREGNTKYTRVSDALDPIRISPYSEGATLPLFLNIKSPHNIKLTQNDTQFLDRDYENIEERRKNDQKIDWGIVNSDSESFYSTFNSTQIKSATGNDGFFNDSSPKFYGEKKSTIDPKIVEANAKLNDVERIGKAKELLWSIIEVQEQAILDAHNQPGEIYNLDFSQIRSRTEILKKAGFASDQIRLLMENGICGRNTREKVLSIIEPLKKFLWQENLDLALSTIEKIAPSDAYKTSNWASITNKIDMFYSFLDTFGGDINPSDFVFMSAKLKMLKDSLLGSVELYTDNIVKNNNLDEVIENAKLPPKQRIMKWWNIISSSGVQFDMNLKNTQIIEDAILRAHGYGYGAEGKNGDPSSIYNYTIKQLGKKMYILIDAMQKVGIEATQAKKIAKEFLRKGICGEVAVETKQENIENKVSVDTKNNEANVDKIDRFIEKYKSTEITEYLWDIQKVYTDNLPKKIKQKIKNWEPLAQKEIQIQQAYDIRFKMAIEYMSASGTMVKFRDSNGERKNTNINEYGKNLLSQDIYASPEWQIFFNKIKKYMFYQTLDNPLQFCSHGFDHSILVDEYVKNIAKDTDVVNKTMEKYNISQDAATVLLRLTAVFHDFGYPNVGDLDKSTHGPFGWLLFKNEISQEFESLFSKQFWVDHSKVAELTKDMTDAIFFHSADKVEQWYLNKIKFTKGEFLIGEKVAGKEMGGDIEKETNILSDVINIMKSWDNLTVYYRKWNRSGQANAYGFKQQLMDLGIEWNRIQVKEDIGETNYDAIYGTEIYQWRKSKSITDFGIEFKPIDLYTNPLSGVVRLADNFDMSLNRLTELQKWPIFMGVMYNFGMIDTSPNASSTIFQRIEKIVDMEVSPEKTQKIEMLKQQIIDNSINLSIQDTQAGNIKERRTIKIDESTMNKIFKADWSLDMNEYKLWVVEQLAIIHNITDAATIQGTKNIALEKKSWSYSFRHFAWLTPIQDVTLMKKNEQVYNDNTTTWENKETTVIKVIVNENVYDNSELANQSVEEKIKDPQTGSEEYVKIRLSDYHIWRLYDASARVTVGGSLLQVEIYNEVGQMIWKTNRTNPDDGFKIDPTK